MKVKREEISSSTILQYISVPTPKSLEDPLYRPVGRVVSLARSLATVRLTAPTAEFRDWGSIYSGP